MADSLPLSARSESERHGVWTEPDEPVGMLSMFSARCICGWRGEPTPDESEAREAERQHRRDIYEPTLDDLAWSLGTGRWSQ